jgi:hypothetical protein
MQHHCLSHVGQGCSVRSHVKQDARCRRRPVADALISARPRPRRQIRTRQCTVNPGAVLLESRLSLLVMIGEPLILRRRGHLVFPTRPDP